MIAYWQRGMLSNFFPVLELEKNNDRVIFERYKEVKEEEESNKRRKEDIEKRKRKRIREIDE